MAIAQASGIPFHFDIEVQPGKVSLRTGIYDASTANAQQRWRDYQPIWLMRQRMTAL